VGKAIEKSREEKRVLEVGIGELRRGSELLHIKRIKARIQQSRCERRVEL
jgi:hypothetical protein